MDERRGVAAGPSARREAWQAMRELAHDRGHFERVQAVVTQAGLTGGLTKALCRIPLDAPVSMRELAGLMQCDSSYVTSVVDSLEEHGLAERRSHPTDRRVKVVSLTPAGARLSRSVRTAMSTPPPVFDVLSDEEAAQLRDLMQKLQRAAHAGAPRPAVPLSEGRPSPRPSASRLPA